MIKQIDNVLWYKLNGFLRLLYVKGIPARLFDTFVVTEYPKSGGTWLSQLVSSSLDIPYPRYRLPALEDSVIHGCYLNSANQNKTIVINRDGRDIMVSYYYHSLVKKPQIISDKAVDHVANELGITDVADINKNLPVFIDYCFSGKAYPRFTWSEFVHKWHGNESVIHTSYEALSRDANTELGQIVNSLRVDDIPTQKIKDTIDKFSFEKQANRKKGHEDSNSFLRKGIVGDWQNAFSQEARELFDSYAGNELILLGYETDHSWVSHKK